MIDNSRLHIGWREWIALPELGIPAVKAKIDTGARTSALHAFQIDPFTDENSERLKIRFGIHPLRKRPDLEIFCVAEVIDQRMVKNSGGHREERYVIQTPIQIGDQTWPVEITLTNRDKMRFRMLLGRTALAGRVRIDPGSSYLQGRALAKTYTPRARKG